ncbi:hypothetical protein CTATCC11996_03327 [Comamonas testosteroni ATCC 11996]|nr:hypothetical protein CTATCC11996_03327 [Comamonas testosteroni ATCC 11996]
MIQQYAHEINVVEARGNGRPPGPLPIKAQAIGRPDARNAKKQPDPPVAGLLFRILDVLPGWLLRAMPGSISA